MPDWKAKLPGRPVAELYRPLRGDCGLPSALSFWPARQPTAASTLPVPCCTTTSVTMLAKKQVGCATSVQVVGSTTLVKLAPASAER